MMRVAQYKKGENDMDCLFCEMVAGNIPTRKLYEDERVLAFYDINPQAPVHFLVIPKEHIASADGITQENADIVAYIFSLIPTLAKKAGLTNGYRIITNCGPDACQSVLHLHFHVLGGAQLTDKMS